jgi:ADP-heptose:LPS heptosyltransferase
LHEAALNLRMLSALDLYVDLHDAAISAFTRMRPVSEVPELARSFCNQTKTVLLHPLSHGSAVDWPLELFAELALMLTHEGIAVGITGTTAERERMGNRLPWDKVTDFCGALSLAELVAVIANSGGLVAGSTGPLHLAAALGVNALGLYSPKRPLFALRWRPIGPKAGFIEAREHPTDGHLSISVLNVFEKVVKWE